MSKIFRHGIPRKENGKIDFMPKKHHGFTGFIWLLGFIIPPLAVLVRFGVGKDLFINIPLTICGWIPGQLHNWFIQNVRNNDNQARTPKWARRYGLVDETGYKRKAKKRAWVGKYRDRDGSRRVVYDEETGRVVELPPIEGEEQMAIDEAQRIRMEEDEFYNPDRPTPTHHEMYGNPNDGIAAVPQRKRFIPSLRSRTKGGEDDMPPVSASAMAEYDRDSPFYEPPAASGTAARFDGDELDRELTGAGAFAPTPSASATTRRRRRRRGTRRRSNSTGSSSEEDSVYDGPEEAGRSVVPRASARSLGAASRSAEAARIEAYDASRERQSVAVPPSAGATRLASRSPSPSSSPAAARQPDIMDVDHQF